MIKIQKVLDAKRIILVFVICLFSLSAASQVRECYPWKPRIVPYLKTQIQFYQMYRNTHKQGKISAETRDYNIKNLINNLKQSHSFVLSRKSCNPPKGISEKDKQAFLEWMQSTIDLMLTGNDVQMAK